ncbi:ROK family protein [Tuanshanicoccus lijuaniae]|uniref:ROK family protein n=1 Tax=Aerococcaceae bacterium zg-1292 TaxID=2774330 RepID=UPI001934D59C|nr:ROK family protein [Aerococcaceae bacterium zg-1292]QQA37748.1 ROK family protein [Aerococcaceae bacterium zg-1292]
MYLGIDIGGTFIKYGLVDELGNISHKNKIATPLDKEPFIEALARIIRQCANEDIKGIGISMPGVIREDGFLITAGAIRSIYQLNLIDLLHEYTNLPITVDNDGNCVAIAEKWLGNAQALSNYICMVIGTGIGGGFVINNQLYRGFNGMAGEFGWMIIEHVPETGPIEPQSTLNFNGAVILGLCGIYNKLHKEQNPDFIEVSDARIVLENEEIDPFAKIAVETFYAALSKAIINFDSLFDPQAILIGGGITEYPDFYDRLMSTHEQMVARHESYHFMVGKTACDVKLAKLKNDAGLLGAVYQVKQKIQAE